MKNLVKIKSILLYSMCIAGTAFFVSSCDGNKTDDSRDIAEQENAANLTADNRTGDNRVAVVIENDDDAKFLMDAAEMQHEEIRLGQLAQQKGNTADVKELGKMMEQDHSKALTELQALAQSKSVSIPTSATEDTMDSYKDLNDKTGNDFGKAYSDLMVEHHEDAIELYEKAAENSEDPQIRAYATEKLPGLRTHLKHAEACKEKTDNINS